MADEEEKEITTKKTNKDGSKYIDLSPTTDDSTFTEEVLDEKIHAMSFAERLKRSQTMRRFAGKIELAKERARKRRASPEKMKERARKRAIEIIRKKVLRDTSYSSLSTSEKMSLDRRLERIPQSVFDKIARKQLPIVKRKESERIQQMMASHSAAAPSVSESIDVMFEDFIKKRPHRMFKSNGSVHFDKRFKLYRDKHNVHESIADLIESVEQFVDEGLRTDRAHDAIQAERLADNIRHKRMMDSAKLADKRMRQTTVSHPIASQHEDVDPIHQIIDRERMHRELSKALKEYHSKVKKNQYTPDKEKEEFARIILQKADIPGFSYKDLMDLHDRIGNAKKYNAAWNAFDAAESVIDPSSREQGTDSLTLNYKEATPGQDINERFEQLFETSIVITPAHMKAFEQFVDKMFEKYKIDFDFTNHFRERISDSRNKPQINISEIADVIKKLYAKYKHGDKALSKYVDTEVVLKDMQSDLNMPIAIEYNRKDDELEVAMKTIMRKKNFHSPDPELKV